MRAYGHLSYRCGTPARHGHTGAGGGVFANDE